MSYHGKLQLLGRACLALGSTCGKNESISCLAVASIAGSRNFSVGRALDMRFVQFTSKDGGPQHLGVQLKQGGDIIAVSAVDSRIPNTLKKFLEGGDDLLKKAKRYVCTYIFEKLILTVNAIKKVPDLNVNICFARDDDFDLRKAVERIVAEGRSIMPEADVNLLAPITRMDKLACIGLNYSGHCQEQNKPTPESPIVFSKFPSNIIGPQDNILLPQISDKIDWEAELAIVIGKTSKGLSNDNVEDCIFGYTIAQDITARDWQKQKRNGGQFLLGKAMDTFCPLGPAVITKEAICDINNLSVRTWVNGKLKQDGNTSELIFKPQDIVAYLSQFVTLLPGDVILTGTPAGVGFTRNPPEYLQRGDVLETEIESLGRLRNKVI